MTYQEKLKSPQWQKKRLAVLQRDEWKCRWCGDEETQLHVHHLKYAGEKPEDTPETDLISLCAHCHDFVEQLKLSDRGKNIVAMKLFNKDKDAYLLIFKLNGGIHLKAKTGSTTAQITTGLSNESVQKILEFING